MTEEQKDAENEQLKRTLEFYRDQTQKVRTLVNNSREIGLPNQNIFEAIVDHINSKDEEIERLKAYIAKGTNNAVDKHIEHNEIVKGKDAEIAELKDALKIVLQSLIWNLEAAGACVDNYDYINKAKELLGEK